MGHFLPEKLMTSITSVKSKTGSSIDVPLTYKTKGFYHSGAFRTGLSDCYKPVVTFFKAYFKKLPHKARMSGL